jgi:site-specific DNA recombinase
MLGMLDEEFASLHASSETERHQLTVEKDRIQDQRRASLQAHYAGALPLDLLKEEQDRLARQLDLVTARLDALDTTYEEARTHLHECLALAGDCQTVYACGSDTTRRMANQAFFTRIYLDADDTMRTEPTRPDRSGCCSTPTPSTKPAPGRISARTRASVPLEPSCLMSRVRVGRVEWS